MNTRSDGRPHTTAQLAPASSRAKRLTQQALRERGATATADLRATLQISALSLDTAILGTALAEIAADECRRNPAFAHAIRARYDEITTLRSSKAGGSKPTGSRAQASELVPIGNIPGWQADPFSPPNPHALTQVYGRPQLARALDDYTVEALKQAAAEYEARFPGTKPTNRGQRAPLIAYIVAQYDREQAGW